MARRRITEEDLLDYRRRAGELSEQLAVKYDELEKAKKAEEELEVRDLGVLVLRGADTDKQKLQLFADNARAKGFAVEFMDLEKYPSYNNRPTKRVPAWEEEMDKAQTGYIMLTEHASRVAVLGTGDSAPTATLIAEQYPVDALVIVGQGPQTKPFTPKRTVAKLAGVARNNLFSIVCPVYCISPEEDNTFKPTAAQLFRDSSRSEDVQLETVSGMSVSGMWTDCEHELETRIFDYLARL